MILIGLIALINFFYWFYRPELVQDKLLFILLFVSLLFDAFRLIYIWYHYWSISAPEIPKQKKNFTVDVFTTYFPGEPYDMIENTLLAIQKMKYPHTTYLCDEANDVHLKKFCVENNIIHVTRNNRINAKAGNINNALLQAKGEICLILDPDHIPEQDFLTETIQYFFDERIGFVQTAQGYYNINESLVARGAAEQTFQFYGPVMMSMNTYGTVNAIGANCIFRRKALDSIGGHAPGLSEDMHTAMQLHAKGWKSIYIPKIFTKGLVPATLTSYYHQQLKWSRGTFELLLTVYPNLYKSFTFRQKIHYGILPLGYISGLIFLICILIPIISLFNATSPWSGNFKTFGFLFLPIFISILSIRFYVQKWMMHKSERGAHLIGGTLLFATWWVYVIGFVYAIIRKKVPYLPTSKNDQEYTNWKIVFPNLLLGFISIIAVIYGLSIDYTPFSLIMSGFALLNALMLFSTLVFAYQKRKPTAFNFVHTALSNSSISNKINNLIFYVVRKIGLPLLLLSLILSIVFQLNPEILKTHKIEPNQESLKALKYIGAFAPKFDKGLSDITYINNLEKDISEKIDIISLYLAWNDKETLPYKLLDSIYSNQSIPMITWEPWLNKIQVKEKNKLHVYDLINNGELDDFIKISALKFKKINRPFFLRFAHEFDNPFYPWFIDGDEGYIKFKKAWIHVCTIFKDQGVENAIWVWNPWHSENMLKYYPGKAYVDWVGIDILNYNQLNQDKKSYSFDQLYNPFYIELKKIPYTPVIIAEYGALLNDSLQTKWINESLFKIETKYPEIKSLVFFNSNLDRNLPQNLLEESIQNLDWTLSKNTAQKLDLVKPVGNEYLYTLPVLHQNEVKSKTSAKSLLLKKIKGIHLKKENDWRKDYNVLTRYELLKDIDYIKQLNLNTIKYIGNSIYDYNVLTITKEKSINISYGFSIPVDMNFYLDPISAIKLKKDILDQVKKFNKYNHIISWNICDDFESKLYQNFSKPELLYQKEAYYKWINDVVLEINKLDALRPIVLELDIDARTINKIKEVKSFSPNVHYFGLLVDDLKFLNTTINFINNNNLEYIVSSIKPNQLIENKPVSFFINSLRDDYGYNHITFDGIIDRNGIRKERYFQLQNYLANNTQNKNIENFKILKPTNLLYEGKKYEYKSIYYDSINCKWQFGYTLRNYSFEWYLLKEYESDKYSSIEKIGDEPFITVTIPKNYENYRLLLTVKKDSLISQTISILNTPTEFK